ncbi:unnamed protein product [Prunus armeniaca]|uniref:Uncharacterized protein n=1 Tax=Prunus armeniaca TaxID=36596 RepID=A0A6J5UQE4_PRUAR|nr:unnamed protein product [Prunus armeniaca]
MAVEEISRAYKHVAGVDLPKSVEQSMSVDQAYKLACNHNEMWIVRDAETATRSQCSVEQGPFWGYEEGEAVSIAGVVLRVDGEVESGGEVGEFFGVVFAEEEGLAVGGSAHAAIFNVIFSAFGKAEEMDVHMSIALGKYGVDVVLTEAGETEV